MCAGLPLKTMKGNESSEKEEDFSSPFQSPSLVVHMNNYLNFKNALKIAKEEGITIMVFVG